MTDEPQIRGASPDDIEAALEGVRARIVVPPAPVDHVVSISEKPRGSGLGTVALALIAALLGGAAVLYLPPLAGLGASGTANDQRRLGELEQRVGQLSTGDSNKAAAQGLRDLGARLDGLELRLHALESAAAKAPAGLPPDPALTGRLDDFSASLAALTTRLATLEQAVAALPAAPAPLAPALPPAPPPSPVIDTHAVDALDAKLDALTTAFTDLTTRLAAVEQRLPGEGLVAALDRRISELENADPGRAARNAALALTVARLGEAVAAGRPFTAELAALKQAAPAGLDTSAFDPYAASGLPSVQRLAADLEALDPAIRAGADEDRGGDWLDRFWRGLTGLVTVRTAGEPQGDAPEDRLDRARRRLADGDLRTAAGELDWLWGQARTAAADWIAKAKARLALDDALSSLTLAILQDLSRP